MSRRFLGYEVFRIPVVRKSMFNVTQNRSEDDRNWMEKNMLNGMGCFDLTAHIFEIISFLFGFETFCIKLHDDLGFKSSLLVPPDTLRKLVLPWHKKCAEIAHRAGKPYLLHSCGNVAEIMEDLIVNVQIDGKHSFEDEIMPVTEASRMYGDRLAIIGGKVRRPAVAVRLPAVLMKAL